MKICIPTGDDRGMEGRAFPHFGSAPFFTVVESEGGGVEILKNPDCHAHPDSCHHVPQLKAHGVGVVVGDGIGRRAAAALAEAGIGVRTVSAPTVSEIVEKTRRGETLPAPIEEAESSWGRGRRRGFGHGHRRSRTG